MYLAAGVTVPLPLKWEDEEDATEAPDEEEEPLVTGEARLVEGGPRNPTGA